MSPRPDVSEERKSQILEAATRVFARLGLSNVRMDDIADEAGLSKGTLYWYFKNKDELIIGIVEKLLGREINELKSLVFAPDTSGITLLNQFIDIAIDDFRKLLPFMPIFYEFIGLAMRHKNIRPIFKHYFRSYMHILVPLIEKGIDQGEFRKVNPEEAAIAVGAVFEGTILLNIYDPETVDVEHHLRSGLKLFVEGLKAP